MLRLQIVETIEVCRENLMLGFAGLQDLRSSPGDLQRLNKTGALFLLGLVRQLPLDNFQSAARGLQLAEARFERIEPLGRIRSGLPRLLVTIPRRLPAPLRLRFSCRRPVNVILLIDPLSDALIGSAADDRPDLCLQRRLDAAAHDAAGRRHFERSEEHTSELQSLMRISYAVFCLNKKKHTKNRHQES